MLTTEIVVIGGGPAGMNSALAAASQGAEVTLLDRNWELGGQLVKQTHKFFGSENQFAGERGIDIAKILSERVHDNSRITVRKNSSVLGIYHDGVLTFEQDDKYKKLTSRQTVVATGAAEKFLSFTNNDLPGVYGAGAVQTLMNQQGVLPGKNVLIIGAGNIGLIVAYQLLQAGVSVEAIIEALPEIGGYEVHRDKIKRMGVPILTSHSIKKAYGEERVEGAIIGEIDSSWSFIDGTKKDFKADVICLAVGLSPLIDLLHPLGLEISYVPNLGGLAPKRDEYLETTISGYFVAGDCAGVEEASSAMMEGNIAGLSAANSIGYKKSFQEKFRNNRDELRKLREGETAKEVRAGLGEVRL
ncbi:FAD-dependent oxidoreductase [Candidatus Bipolaricaulota bacterium]|nr:FAD-dependent oxidoreductase [Candidatus Bipolaricaulota bacterium]